MGPRVADTGLITTSALIVMAVLAAVTIAGILWGVRLQRARRAARKTEAERIEANGGTITDADAPVAEADASMDDSRQRKPEPARKAAEPVARIAPMPQPVEDAAPAPPTADEPIPAAAPLEASPATVAEPAPESAAPEPAPVEPEPEPVAPSGPPPGDRPVTLLKGLGPKVAARLAELGVTTVADMAALDAMQAEAIDAHLGPFTGRMTRDRWIEQARFLAAGDVKGFEAVFGKL